MTTPVTDDSQTDAFGRQLTLNVQNEADIAAHYPYSPERYRVFKNGTRQQIQYNGTPTEYEDIVDGHKLKPQSDGDVVTMETAEIYRYVVQYVLEWSAAMQANQALQSGDAITLAFGDSDLNNSSDDTPGPSADGWMWIWDSGLDTDEVRIAQYRNGTEKDARVVTGNQALTDYTRRAVETNWYNVGASGFTETYSENGEQFNPKLGGTSVDDSKGPEIANHPIQFSVKVGSSGAGSLEAELGSVGLRNLGDASPIFRRKSASFIANIDSTGTYVALDAIRIDPDRRIINTQLTRLTVEEYSANDDVEVLGVAFSPDKLQDSSGNAIVDGDFSTPVEHSSQSSVLETTTAVDQFPNSSGTIGTSASDPGGFQEGYTALYTSGTGGQGSSQVVPRADEIAKRPVNERDIVVFLGKSGSTGDVTVEYTVEQQW